MGCIIPFLWMNGQETCEEVIVEEDNESVSKVKETYRIGEIGGEGEREWRRENQMEGIDNDHHGREASLRRCSNEI